MCTKYSKLGTKNCKIGTKKSYCLQSGGQCLHLRTPRGGKMPSAPPPLYLPLKSVFIIYCIMYVCEQWNCVPIK